MSQELSAERLLSGVAERNKEMLGRLYDAYAPKLFGVISQILEDRAAAQEVLQELFTALWKDAQRVRLGNGSAVVWLMLEARARAVDRRRADAGLAPLRHSGLKSLRKSTAWLPTVEEVSRLEERQSLLNKTFHRLPSSQAQLLEAAVFQGATETEMAVELRQPPARAEGELRAALRFLGHRVRAVLGTWTADI